MKFLFSTDQHVKGTNFKQRLDDFPKTVLEKMREVNQIAKREQVVAQLMGGDLLDIPGIAPSVVTAVQTVFSESTVPIFSVIGNHCIYGNPLDIAQLPIGNIMSSGYIKRLSSEPAFFSSDNALNGLFVAVTGSDAVFGTDRDANISDYCPVRDKDADVHIHIAHGWLCDKPIMESIPHTLINDIIEHTEADIILTGHWHKGYGIIKRKNSRGQMKMFINPGALSRVNASLEEYDRFPMTALIEIFEDGSFDAQLVPITIAKPGIEVIDRDALECEIERKKTIERFSDNLGEHTIDMSKTLEESLEEYAKESKVDKKILDEAIKMIHTAQTKIMELTRQNEKE